MFRRRAPGAIPGSRVTLISRKMIEYHAEWARKFVRGGIVEKPAALVLSGYTPVQNASYFALPLAPNLDMLAVDRQITTTDSRQSEFLGDDYQAHPDSPTLAVLPDPVYHFGEPSRTGTQMVESLHLDLASRETFVLTGDIHHYERLERGKLLHVIAGGGGASCIRPGLRQEASPPRSGGPAWRNVAGCYAKSPGSWLSAAPAFSLTSGFWFCLVCVRP